jgi:GDP-mannose transporter
MIPLLLSCIIGVGMSHASYLLREACSATLFTVVGIICKVRHVSPGL